MSFKLNKIGIFDLISNAREWCDALVDERGHRRAVRQRRTRQPARLGRHGRRAGEVVRRHGGWQDQVLREMSARARFKASPSLFLCKGNIIAATSINGAGMPESCSYM